MPCPTFRPQLLHFFTCIILPCCVPDSNPALVLSLQHVFNKNPIPSGAVLHKDMGDCSDEFPVLNNGCTAHALDDTSGQSDQFRVGHFQFDSPVYIVMI